MQIIDSRIADDLLTSSTQLHEKARLLACRTKHSGDWLTVFPSTYHFCLLDSHFTLAVRLRLGLPPQDDLPLYCKCKFLLASDPNHFLSCKLFRRTTVTTRHDTMVQLLCNFTRSAGCAVFIEPKGLDGVGGKRPDALIHFPSRCVHLDGSITHPAATTYAPMASKTPLVAAKNREGMKHSKYDLIAANEKSSFVPFVMETFGGFGGEALNFLKQISRCHSDQNPTPSPTGAFKTLVSRALSVCLERYVIWM